ncbi:MAG TPA: FUSC family protein, partial [Solirubrobacteraceae bacterium]
LDERLAALGGQLRAIARSAPVAGRRGRLFERAPSVGIGRPWDRVRSNVVQLRANATLQSPAGRHALRLGVVVAATEILAQRVPLQRSYWIVVAAAAALRPDFATTFTRGAERILGTVVGVGLAGAIVVGLNPGLGVVVPIVGVLAWLAYALFPASFAAGFAFTTALVVFLLDAVSPDTLTTASDRLLDMLLGGAIGLAAYLLWPTWSHKPARQALADVVAAQRAYLALVLGAAIAGERLDDRDAAPFSRRARLAYTTAQQTVARSLAEPAARQIDATSSRGTLASLRRIVGAIHVLRTDARGEGSREPRPALAPLARQLDAALVQIAGALTPAPALGDEAPRELVLPPLREGYTRLRGRLEQSDGTALLLRELDEIVDAVNSLAAAVAHPPSPPPGARVAPGAGLT